VHHFRDLGCEKESRMAKNTKHTYLLLILANVLVWIVAFLIYHQYPISLSLCLLAYGFGLRHGLDADHVAAIDSATRKLLETSETKGFIGFFFSLGHSSIVIILSLLVALTATSIHRYFPHMSEYGTIIGCVFSIFFLFIFSITNLVICVDVFKKIKHYDERPPTPIRIKIGGFLSKILNPVLKIVTKSWHMYLVGFLFGLGFDTATEIALLGMSAYTVTQHLSVWAIMIFPALFTAGMCLVDTTSGLLILKACRWAYINPTRKLYYNLVVTLFSFLTAFSIAIYEVVSMLSSQYNFAKSINVLISGINNHFDLIGGLIVCLFLLVWLFSIRSHRKLVR